MKQALIYIMLSTFIFGSASNCQHSKNQPSMLTEITDCQYNYYDASVAPIYYRNYYIAVNLEKDKIDFGVTTSIDTLITETYSLDKNQKTQLLSLCKALETEKEVNKEEEHLIIGGPEHSLRLVDKAKKELFQRNKQHKVSPSAKELIDFLHSLVPQQKELVAKTQITDIIQFTFFGENTTVDFQEINALAKPYGFELNRLEETPKDAQLIDKIKKHNRLADKLMAIQQEKNWREKFEKETGKSLSQFNCFQ